MQIGKTQIKQQQQISIPIAVSTTAAMLKQNSV